MTDPRQELQRVKDGELAFVNVLHISKRSGYDLFRVKEIATEMGLVVAGAERHGSYWATLPLGEGQGRIDA